MSEKYKKTCKYLNYVEHVDILALTVTGCISFSAFASLVAILVGITSSAVGIKKLNTIQVLISKHLIDSYISHDEFVSINDILREYYEIRERRNKKSWNFCGIHYIKTMETYYSSCKKYTGNENSIVQKTKQNRLMLSSNCTVCGKKKLTFKWLVQNE